MQYNPSKAMLFRRKLAELLNTAEVNVDVFSIQNVPEEENMVYVMFAAHGSPYYSSARLNGQVWANKADVSISYSPILPCCFFC